MVHENKSALVLALDVGTTGLKAVLYAVTGELVAAAQRGYRTRHPEPMAAEQDPASWWRAACACIGELRRAVDALPDRVCGIGLSGMMNGCVMVDASGRPIRPAIIHADTRGRGEAAALERVVGRERYYELSGCHPEPFYTLAKLAWIQKADPEALTRARWCIQSKEYIAGRLTNVWGQTDLSDASLTGMLDVRSREWSAELVREMNLPVQILPEIVPSTTVLGGLTPRAALATGLKQGTPVVMGAGDGACATIGSGAWRPRDAYHYLGGTSWIAVLNDRYEPDPGLRTSHLYGVTEHCHVSYGAVQSAGTSLEWFLREVGFGRRVSSARRLAALQPLASSSPAGAGDLYFLPYLDGERAPIWDAGARGAFIGLTTRHTRADMARAVMEGVAFALHHVLASFDERGLGPEVIRVLGGGMRSRLWRAIFSGVFARPLHLLERPDACTACGAAMVATAALGMCRDLGDAVSRFVRIHDVERPEPSLVREYAQRSAFYRTLYPALADRFLQMSLLSRDTP